VKFLKSLEEKVKIHQMQQENAISVEGIPFKISFRNSKGP
jgi:hypothetical protein